jgi:hypothetical protein
MISSFLSIPESDRTAGPSVLLKDIACHEQSRSGLCKITVCTRSGDAHSSKKLT